jgi:hypothetical protein
LPGAPDQAFGALGGGPELAFSSRFGVPMRGRYLEVSLKSLLDLEMVDIPAQRRSPVKRRLIGRPASRRDRRLPAARTREETS